jgi:hypothetical protein
VTPSLDNPWQRFFFADTDLRVFAGMRIAVSGLLLIHLAVLAPNWILWFGDAGRLDVAAARAIIDPDVLSVFFLLPGDALTLWVCFGIMVVQVIALGVGFATRFNSIGVFVWLVSLHHRNNLIWEGEDVLLRLALFLLVFMPTGRRWSIDALWRRHKRAEPRPPGPGGSPIWPIRLLQLQLSLLYLSTMLSKLGGAAWQDGSALYYALQLDEFSGHRLPLPEIVGDHLPILRLLTWSALAVEVLLVFGVWVPSLRRPTVLVGIGFHLALEFTLNLFMFQWLMILILGTHLVTPLAGGGASSPAAENSVDPAPPDLAQKKTRSSD